MNELTITAEVERSDNDHKLISPGNRVIFDPILKVDVIFTLRINGSRSSKSIVAHMEARNRGDQDCLRDELLQSVSLIPGFDIREGDDLGPIGDEWKIETIDPLGVIAWLGINFETFKTYQQNAKSLRLPAGH